MSLSAQGIIKGLVQRALGSFNPDSVNSDVAVRQLSYGEICTQPMVRKAHNLADEGSYFVGNNAQTSVAPSYNTAFTATAPVFLVYNGNTNSQRVYLDYIALTANAAGACTTTQGFTALAIVLDTGNRYTSGGTQLTLVSPNYAFANAPSGVLAYCGAITATAASGGARTIVGQRNIRPGVSSTVINVQGDLNLLNFGSVEGAVGSITIANANVMPMALPPLIIPPGSSGLVYITYAGMSAPSAATYFPEIGLWAR